MSRWSPSRVRLGSILPLRISRRVIGLCPLAALAANPIFLAACAPPSTIAEIRSPTSPSHSSTPSTTSVAAGGAFRLVYRNDDLGAEHDVAIYDHQGGREIAVTANIVGPGASTDIVIPALSAGTYFVQCDIHPFMTAVLTVQ